MLLNDQCKERRWLLSQATDAPQYLMRIYAQLAFFYTKCDFKRIRKTLVAIGLYWMHLRVNLIYLICIKSTKTVKARYSLRDDFSSNVAVYNVYQPK